MIRSRRKTSRGFTLTELLVVIAIVVALVAMLLPMIRKTREAAWTVACMGNMRQIAGFLMIYQSDNNGVVPQGGMGGYFVGDKKFHHFCWSDYFIPTAQTGNSLGGRYNIRIDTCACLVSTNTKISGTASPGTLFCPKSFGIHSSFESNDCPYYAIARSTNDPGAFTTMPWGSAPNGGFTFEGFRIAALPSPANFALCVEAGAQGGTPRDIVTDVGPTFEFNTGNNASSTGGGQSRFTWLMHPNGVNICFGDGHCETCDAGRIATTSNYNGNNPPSKRGITYYWDYHGVYHHS